MDKQFAATENAVVTESISAVHLFSHGMSLASHGPAQLIKGSARSQINPFVFELENHATNKIFLLPGRVSPDAH